MDNGNPVKLRTLLDASFQGVKRLIVLGFDNADNGANKVKRDSDRKYFLPRVDITNYNVLINWWQKSLWSTYWRSNQKIWN